MFLGPRLVISKLKVNSDKVPTYGGFARKLATIGRELKRDLAASAPKRTGRSAKDITVETQAEFGAVTMRVEIPEPLAFTITGTRRHEIRSRFGKALKFSWERINLDVATTNLVFFRKIMHPGTKGSPWHVPAVDRAEEKAVQLLQKYGAELQQTFRIEGP